MRSRCSTSIHSVDRPKIARALAEEIARSGKRPRLLVQVNTGEEPQKAGVLPAETGNFVAQCRDEYGLAIEGLMCIPPLDEEPALHFALLAKIARPARAARAEHGHERRFRRGHRLRRDLCPHRHGHLRRPRYQVS